MTPEQFTYWLQGFVEINNPETFDKKQTQILKDHLNLVFDKITPDRNKEETDFTQFFPSKKLTGIKPRKCLNKRKVAC